MSRVWLVAVLACCAGCGGSSGTYPVTGTVKLPSGEPLSGGRILFQPVGGAGKPARGTIAADGTFELGTFQEGDGAVPGQHSVVITPSIPVEATDNPSAIARYRSVIDSRYQAVQTTPLEMTVKDDGTDNHFDIVLERPRKR